MVKCNKPNVKEQILSDFISMCILHQANSETRNRTVVAGPKEKCEVAVPVGIEFTMVRWCWRWIAQVIASCEHTWSGELYIEDEQRDDFMLCIFVASQ